MLPRARVPLLAVRTFILAPVSTPLQFVPSGSASTAPSCYPSQSSNPHSFIASFSTTNTKPKSVPYALTAAARAFAEQVQREELDFLPHAYEHLRQVVLDAQRRGFSLSDSGEPILSQDIVKRARSLLAISPQREHAVLHLAVFDDRYSVLRVDAEMIHPLEFTAQIFQKYLRTDAVNTLMHIYDHLRHLADATATPRKVFATKTARWRTFNWMQHLAGKQSNDILPRILHDLPRLFGLRPTLVHHQLVIRGFLSSDMPDKAWSWLRKMEQHESSTKHTVRLKPRTEHYDLLLKYFAKRGDHMSVHMVLARMPAHAAPSHLSYHFLLAAILTATPTPPKQRVLVEATVDELQRIGRGVHLRTLGGIAGRGALSSWVTEDVLEVLRAAQVRSNARAKILLPSVRKQRGGGPDVLDIHEMEGSTSVELTSQEVRGTASDLPTRYVKSQQSNEVPPDTSPTPIPSKGIEDKQVSAYPILPKKTAEDSLHLHSSPGIALDVKAEMDNASEGHNEKSADATTYSDAGEQIEDGSQNLGFKKMLDTVRRKNITPFVDVVAVDPSDIPHPKIDKESTEFSVVDRGVPTEDVSFSERLQQWKIAQPPKDQRNLLTDPPEQRTPQDVLAVEEQPMIPEQVTPEVTSNSMNSPQSSSSSSSRLDHTPKQRLKVGGELPRLSEISISPNEQILSKSTIKRNARVRRRYSNLIDVSLQEGDIRHASKIYAQSVAVMGPDPELGGIMIKALCKRHLLKPPPRPHIIQALRIYRSLLEMEKQTVDIKGFFDGAYRGHKEIDIDIYKHLLRALSAPAPVDASSRDYGPEVYKEYAIFTGELLADMEARGLKPDERTLVSVLLLRFKIAKNHREAFNHYKTVVANEARTLESVSSRQVDNTQTTPRRVFGRAEYKAILNAFAKLSLPDAPVVPAQLWFSIVDDMRARGYPVTVADYTRFLSKILDSQPSILLANGEESRLQSLYACVTHVHSRLALDANISPDAFLLNTLMNVYQHLGAFEDALRVFNLLWSSGRMDDVTPIIIFDACGHAGQQNVARTIWCLLVAKGWRFDKLTLDTWVECLTRTDVEAACKFVCVYMGRENAGYLSKGDTRPDVQTCLILLKLSWLKGQNNEVKDRIKAHLPHIWDQIALRYK